VIDGGRIVEHGETYDIFTAPQHATTRSFLSGVTGVTLPAFVKDRLVPNAPAQGGEEVIRVTFAGQHATDPMLARLTQDMGIRSISLPVRSRKSAPAPSAICWYRCLWSRPQRRVHFWKATGL